MIVVASSNGDVGIGAAMEILRAGGTALDAVEAATRLVEDNPDDHSVGYGGYPNLLGEVELDASIMDGNTLSAGTVGCLRGFRHPISVARQVMLELPHVMLVGEGAARFAREIGMVEENLLTPEAAEVYQQGITGSLPPEQQHWLQGGIQVNLSRLVRITADPERAAGTVNFIAQDSAGNIASAVSTSGWSWKYPGRLGDSPIIGAGNYADNRYGACACTGWGELAIRLGTARSVVLYQRMGYDVQQACRQAMEDLRAGVTEPAQAIMHLVALSPDGQPVGMSTTPDRSYIWMKPEMSEPVEELRMFIDLTTIAGPGHQQA